MTGTDPFSPFRRAVLELCIQLDPAGLVAEGHAWQAIYWLRDEAMVYERNGRWFPTIHGRDRLASFNETRPPKKMGRPRRAA